METEKCSACGDQFEIDDMAVHTEDNQHLCDDCFMAVITYTTQHKES